MKLILLFIIILSIEFVSCQKYSEKNYCWVVVDNLGNQVSQPCNKTEAQMISLYPNSCNYYKYEEKTYCWMVNGNFIKNTSESEMTHNTRCYGSPQAVKVDCSYCDKLFSREKRTYKPTGSTLYTSISYKTYCGNDLTAIPANKQIIRKDDADSLIIIQFSTDGTNW